MLVIYVVGQGYEMNRVVDRASEQSTVQWLVDRRCSWSTIMVVGR